MYPSVTQHTFPTKSQLDSPSVCPHFDLGFNTMGKLRAPDNVNMSNNNQTIHNAQQRTAGYEAKRLVKLI